MIIIKILKERYILFLIIIVTISSYAYMTVPKTYKKNFEGVIYRLGKENKDYCEKINITFDGYMKMDKWLEYKHFDGKVEFSDYEKIINNKENIEYIKNSPETSLVFDHNNGSFMTYCTFIKTEEGYNDPNIVAIGRLYFSSNYDNLMIQISEENKWSSSYGLLICAPAQSREEGLQLANKLLSKYYCNHRIKKLE